MRTRLHRLNSSVAVLVRVLASPGVRCCRSRGNEAVKVRSLLGAVEAAGAMDERNGPLAHSTLENAARFPQLPQPAPPGVSFAEPSTRASSTLAGRKSGLKTGVHLIDLDDGPEIASTQTVLRDIASKDYRVQSLEGHQSTGLTVTSRTLS